MSLFQRQGKFSSERLTILAKIIHPSRNAARIQIQAMSVQILFSVFSIYYLFVVLRIQILPVAPIFLLVQDLFHLEWQIRNKITKEQDKEKNNKGQMLDTRSPI